MRIARDQAGLHITLLIFDSFDSTKCIPVYYTIDPYECAFDILMLPLNELPSWCMRKGGLYVISIVLKVRFP
jgi:hypothetical protein